MTKPPKPTVGDSEWIDKIFDNLFSSTGFSQNALRQFAPILEEAKQAILSYCQEEYQRGFNEALGGK